MRLVAGGLVVTWWWFDGALGYGMYGYVWMGENWSDYWTLEVDDSWLCWLVVGPLVFQ